MLSFGPGAGRSNHFCDGCCRKAGAPSSDGGGRAAEKKEKKKRGGPPPPTRQQFLPQRRPDKTDTLEDLYPHLPLLCRPRDPFAFHSSPASIAARPVKAVKTRGGAGEEGGGGVSGRDSSKLGPNLGHPAPLINQRTLSLEFLLFQFRALGSRRGGRLLETPSPFLTATPAFTRGLPARLDPEHGADPPAGPPLREAESDRWVLAGTPGHVSPSMRSRVQASKLALGFQGSLNRWPSNTHTHTHISDCSLHATPLPDRLRNVSL